ncbi:MAG: HigA family addiction module antitoxin [Lachnospiraceae bacterium]|nr:HigA family addiction module antitoxin [Lachnospiraceae bacterium]
MGNYIEYNDKMAFHPGYYLKEMVEESGLTQEDFAKRLGTTPKNLSILVRGEQSLSIDIATKLSRMLGTTVTYWLRLQEMYDEMQAEYLSDEELKREREVFKLIDYSYFKTNFHLPNLPRKIDEQIKCVREFLSVASLGVLQEEDLATSFRSYSANLSQSNIVNANAMVQIAVNKALRTSTPKYDKKKFAEAVEFALTQTENHAGFYPEVQKAFLAAGVVLVVLPNLKNSGINGATKKVNGKILLMVSDRRHFADTFWFSLFHEIGHVINGDYGITFKDNKSEVEDEADVYAQTKLIPQERYQKFLKETAIFNEAVIRKFAGEINRDPGIVLGRLQNDGKISYTQTDLCDKLRRKYIVSIGK